MEGEVWHTHAGPPLLLFEANTLDGGRQDNVLLLRPDLVRGVAHTHLLDHRHRCCSWRPTTWMEVDNLLLLRLLLLLLSEANNHFSNLEGADTARLIQMLEGAAGHHRHPHRRPRAAEGSPSPSPPI